MDKGAYSVCNFSRASAISSRCTVCSLIDSVSVPNSLSKSLCNFLFWKLYGLRFKWYVMNIDRLKFQRQACTPPACKTPPRIYLSTCIVFDCTLFYDFLVCGSASFVNNIINLFWWSERSELRTWACGNSRVMGDLYRTFECSDFKSLIMLVAEADTCSCNCCTVRSRDHVWERACSNAASSCDARSWFILTCPSVRDSRSFRNSLLHFSSFNSFCNS